MSEYAFILSEIIFRSPPQTNNVMFKAFTNAVRIPVQNETGYTVSYDNNYLFSFNVSFRNCLSGEIFVESDKSCAVCPKDKYSIMESDTKQSI